MYVSFLKAKYYSTIQKDLLKKNYKNVMEVPKLQKIVLNVGIGKADSNPKLLESVCNELGFISGQKPVRTKAKKSIAGFKIREGMALGCMVTLRGNNMYEFLYRFISLIVPRIRDFNGFKNSFDGRGNYNIGVKEQIVFPEIQVDKSQSIYGINITFVTNSKNDKGCYDLLESFGFPYVKNKKKKL